MPKLSKGYVSADGHVVEPADLWATRMDRRFRDRAPRVESRPDGDYYIIDGFPDSSVGLEGVAMEDKIAGKLDSPKGRRHADTRAGAFYPEARLIDQQLDNLRAEVIYPGVGLGLGAAPDGEYVRECFRVYNDWLAEFCRHAADRFLGVCPAADEGSDCLGGRRGPTHGQDEAALFRHSDRGPWTFIS
jgi:hypothetical protein